MPAWRVIQQKLGRPRLSALPYSTLNSTKAWILLSRPPSSPIRSTTSPIIYLSRSDVRRVSLRRPLPQPSRQTGMANQASLEIRVLTRQFGRGNAKDPKALAGLSIHWCEDLRATSPRPPIQDDRFPHAA